jgi:RNA polymerase sigma factor (sigma-70 family)
MERTSPVWLTAPRLRRAPVLRSQTARRDAAALAAMYERHHQALYRYCRSILHDDEDARDALQSTMAKALAALRDEERDFELRPWLFRIAHNEAISKLRQRRDTVDLDAATTLGTDPLAQAVEDRERLALLRADLRDLPERQRAALVLRELSGLSHEEIATVLDSSARAVKQTIFEARVSLQDCAEGRAMLCADVQRALSDGDGRVLRGRRVRAHVRSCRSCRQFKAALAQRPGDLAAMAPALPAAAGAALLGHLLPGAKAAGLASSAGAATGAGGGVAATVATKAAIIVAATATLAGTTTAVRAIVASPQRDARPAVAAPHAVRSRPVSAPAPLGTAAHDRAASAAQRHSSGRSQVSARSHRSGASGHDKATKAPGTGAAPTRSSRQQPGAKGHAKANANKQTAHGGRVTPKPVKSHPAHPVHPETTPPGAANAKTPRTHLVHPDAVTPATSPAQSPTGPPAADGTAPGNSASAHVAK